MEVLKTLFTFEAGGEESMGDLVCVRIFLRKKGVGRQLTTFTSC